MPILPASRHSPSASAPAAPRREGPCRPSAQGTASTETTALPGGPAWFQNGFHRYLKRYLKRHFQAIRLSKAGGLPLLEASPTVVYVNHPSWWDPLIGLAVSNLCYPGIQFCAPIDAIQLQRYAVFKKLGLFPVEQGTTRGALSFLHQSKTIFKHHPKAMLWMTPQGCFTDARQRPVFLQDGLAHLARRHREVRFQPLAVEYTFWNNRLPEVLLRFGTPVTARELPPVAAGTESHGLVLAFALQKAQDDLAGESILRQPESFRTLLAGRSGMGGFYQVWKQLQSRLTGRPYQADHNHSLPS